jgi:hypothetical protein
MRKDTIATFAQFKMAMRSARRQAREDRAMRGGWAGKQKNNNNKKDKNIYLFLSFSLFSQLIVPALRRSDPENARRSECGWLRLYFGGCKGFLRRVLWF